MRTKTRSIPAIIATFALASASTGALAQSAAGGAYVGGTLGLLSPDVKISNSGNSVTLGSTSHSLVPGLFAGYGQVLSGAFYLGAEAAYQLAGPEIDDIRISGSGRIRAKVENAWTVSATPGLVVSDKVLAYARLAWAAPKPRPRAPAAA